MAPPSTNRLSRRLAGVQGEQQPDVPAWIGGHLRLPYEQKTQQSPAKGRSTVLQPSHS
jgi:hypothetical protein